MTTPRVARSEQARNRIRHATQVLEFIAGEVPLEIGDPEPGPATHVIPRAAPAGSKEFFEDQEGKIVARLIVWRSFPLCLETCNQARPDLSERRSGETDEPFAQPFRTYAGCLPKSGVKQQ